MRNRLKKYERLHDWYDSAEHWSELLDENGEWKKDLDYSWWRNVDEEEMKNVVVDFDKKAKKIIKGKYNEDFSKAYKIYDNYLTTQQLYVMQTGETPLIAKFDEIIPELYRRDCGFVYNEDKIDDERNGEIWKISWFGKIKKKAMKTIKNKLNSFKKENLFEGVYE